MTSLVFDLIIFGFLLFDLIIIGAFILGWIRIGRKSFTVIPILVFCFMLFAGAVIFYGSFLEPRSLVVTEYSWGNIAPAIAEKMKGIKIALVSDFHLGPYKKKVWVEKVALKLRELNPDFVVITGDFIFERYEPADDFTPLQSVKPRFGMYGVLGNHDYGGTLDDLRNEAGKKRVAKLREFLEAAGVKVLINESIELTFNHKKPRLRLGIGGVDEIWTFHANIEKTFDKRASEAKQAFFSISILLAHNPDVIKIAKDYPIDLVLAGHTHSGQIRLPFWGSVPQIPTKLGNKYDEGLFYFDRFDGKKIPLVITRGVGESGPRARLFAPPEIVILK